MLRSPARAVIDIERKLCDWRLQGLEAEAVAWADAHGWDVVVTSIFRPGGSGIHGLAAQPFRAEDVDLVEIAGTPARPVELYQRDGHRLAVYLCSRYRYGRSWTGRELPAALWHTAGAQPETVREGWHLHLQVPAGVLGMLA